MRKTREFLNHHLDSTVWNAFRFRPDDIVIATYGKSGTTWIQQIVAQLVFHGAEGLDLTRLSPWLDARIAQAATLAVAEAQTHRRFLKTHLPADALVFSPQAKYLYIGRDGRDVVWSLYNHHVNANANYYRAVNDTPGRVGPPFERPHASVRQYFQEWLEKDGYPWAPFWAHVKSWWDIRDLPNVHLCHFAQLKADLPGQIREIAAFLGVALAESKWAAILEHCSFEYMKQHATLSAPGGGKFFEGGAEGFFHKGTNARWRDVLSQAESGQYEAMAQDRLGTACAHWLATGAR